MPDYVLLIPSHEAAWDAASPDERAGVYARHEAFAAALAARGHTITAGAELAPSREAVVVRQGTDGLVVTEGPYAEGAEQLSGFYLISSEDHADLVDCVGILADVESGVELRATASGSAS